ncbi:MAG: hypothetical protein ACRDV3_09915 [Acidothermaceae bacterium]
MSVIGRVAVVIVGATLTSILLAFAGSPSPATRHKLRHLKLPRLNSANLMSYVAAVMAIALASTVAMT